MSTDLVDQLAGLPTDAPLALLRYRRADAHTHTAASHAALFAPAVPGAVSLVERRALGLYVAGLHRAEEHVAHFTATLGDATLAALVAEAVRETLATGPAGHYPPGPLSPEDTPPPAFALGAPLAAALGPRLVAGLAHAHAMVFHPRDASPEAFAALAAAGWDADGIVTLSQIVAFLAYQIRLVAGLRALAASA
ncbi:CMD domain protein [Paracraurococcus lichenis]|uniref:CMD domain protein n=1 Tax=Paracraurococcus lichenis TaxID=3064888 RepID=A0ABT9E5U9_9PROT|nr:CMD domain protein [Paracraurococcus sp. LOR1-02]MDO9711477.1 CMD domain protein [Paracraurococcus sp. LOR1-02]